MNFDKYADSYDAGWKGKKSARFYDDLIREVEINFGDKVLDVGCGNGKMLKYLQKRTNAYIHGFDYSANAINTAQKLFLTNADFKQGIIGEIDYLPEQFDIITLMDTIYFAPDMGKFLLQALRWLKKDGVLFICYQEGDVMPKTESSKTTVLAQALQKNEIPYDVEDITKETYDLLKKKRETALAYQRCFEEEGSKEWFDLLMMQTECAAKPFDVFAEEMARYIYIVRKS